MKDRSSSGGFFLDNEGQNTLVERYEKEENVSEAIGNLLNSTLKLGIRASLSSLKDGQGGILIMSLIIAFEKGSF